VQKPSLRVIKGSWIAGTEWLNFPTTVSAPSPFDRLQACSFRIAKVDVVKAALARRREQAFSLWSIVLGMPPKVPLWSAFCNTDGLTSLSDAHACFQGLKRPCAEDSIGDSLVAYILKPKFFYVYEPSMTCVAKKEDVPGDVVFAVYARMDEPARQGRSPIKGVLSHWHFIDADKRNLSLPIGFDTRYSRRLW
jgi:hypothetical protein